MPVDWTTVAVRFALYLDLMLLWGLPLFAVHALHRDERGAAPARGWIGMTAGAAILGLLLSALSLAVLAKSLTGAAALAELDRDVFFTILTGTDAGGAWIARITALVVCLLATWGMRPWPTARFAMIAVAGAVALGTLAWTGHGAMSEGGWRYLHLACDVAHLLAAGAWVGALGAFVLLSRAGRTGNADEIALLARVATGFARAGTAIVVVLIATGVVNYLLVAGPTLAALWSTAYGVALSAKLAVFAAMLALAAGNRYRLCPRLQRALRGGDYADAVHALRGSLRWEAAGAVGVLALVAWLGVLAPRPV